MVYVPDKNTKVAVFIDTPHGKRWFSVDRTPKDYPGKKHFVPMCGPDGRQYGFRWMTSEEQVRMQLEARFSR